MTNIQAINLLKGLEQSLDDYCELNDEGKTAFRMAITALEVFGNSEQLPSAQPEQRWIPVTERLPKNREWVLGIFQEGDTGWINPIPFICDYVGNKTPITTQDNWLLKLVDEPHPYYKNLHCIAWMPLPETWEEGEQE